MTVFPGPPGSREYVEVGGNLEPMEPTPYIEWRAGVLHQWFVAIREDKVNGTTHHKGEWRVIRHHP